MITAKEILSLHLHGTIIEDLSGSYPVGGGRFPFEPAFVNEPINNIYDVILEYATQFNIAFLEFVSENYYFNNDEKRWYYYYHKKSFGGNVGISFTLEELWKNFKKEKKIK